MGRPLVIDADGLSGKDRGLAQFIEFKSEQDGIRPQDIPEVDEFPEADISDILRNYQGTAFEYQE